MDIEVGFRLIFAVATILLFVVRLDAQRRRSRRTLARQLERAGPSELVGALSALTAVVFGLEYLFLPGAFDFAYSLSYPPWLRWLGVVLLFGGVLLMAWAHHHLGESFSSIPMIDRGDALIESGPYRWIRHPIYLAYFLAYVGGGLVSSNLVLTLAPAALFSVMIWGRIEIEESQLEEEHGLDYLAYMQRTRRFLPFPRRHSVGLHQMVADHEPKDAGKEGTPSD